MTGVVVLGSTGSIGTQALDVVAAHPDRLRVVGLAAAGTRVSLLAQQAAATGAPVLAVPDADAAAAVRRALDRVLPPQARPRVLAGPAAACDIVADVAADVVLNAIDGAAGLPATIAALGAGRRVALANKESLVIGGRLVTDLAGPGQLTPVDSEHSALAQCLRAGRVGEVRRLILTASGGPCRGMSRAALATVTPAAALAHPTWRMGPLVTVNSATLVNKGLEVIEAHLLFGVPYDRIEVVVHPQSMVHSMVEYCDGSTIAQAATPDMRLPIAAALTWPDRLDTSSGHLDWAAPVGWTFEPVDHDTFPAVRLARQAGEAGGCHPAVFNAANETAVAAFLAGRVPFPGIVDTIDDALGRYPGRDGPFSLASVLAADGWARRSVRSRIDTAA